MKSFRNVWPGSSSASPNTPEQTQGYEQRYRTRSTTGPSTYLPPTLTAARPAIHNPDVLFIGAPAAPIPPPLPTTPIPPKLPYPDEQAQGNLRRAKTAPPPVPPHPYRYASGATTPPLPPKPNHHTRPRPPPMVALPPPPPRPPRPASDPYLQHSELAYATADGEGEEEVERISMPEPMVHLPSEPVLEPEPAPEPAPAAESREELQEDDAELAELRAIIAMSQAETLRQEKLNEKMLSQEAADLARALEESMSTSSSRNNSYSSGAGERSTTTAGSSSQAAAEDNEVSVDYMDDAAFARFLAAQEQEASSSVQGEAEPTPTQSSFTGINGSSSKTADKSPEAAPSSSSSADLPLYSPRRPAPELPGKSSDSVLSPDEEFARQIALEEEVLLREDKDKPPEDSSSQLPSYLESKASSNNADLPRLRTGGTELRWVDSSLETPVFDISPSGGDATPYTPDGIRPPSSATSLSEDSDGRPMGANQFLDPDLVRGVSIGFVAPSITPELLPMNGSMPNIISLPYGRCPPLHLQAPTWRHLLRLMARLSGTRIEPTVEAIAVTRSSQMHLRTVVQFVRTHHASLDWRTVLWFTIDHPVPTSMPNARKYTNGDVDTLPWSYTLSSVPALLRDGSDSLLSKFYTIPSSAAVPFPALPISFPNMALYLQAALSESRKYMNDSSSGMRRLGKMVDMCYPQLVEPGEDEGERSRMGMGGLFKKVIGRKDKSRKGKGGNEDTYDLVTPFVLDEWGP
ncbi:hypothetical protein R3P38DRAFT_2832342 [Favolaschia claudopus]|uniref:Uncharacterized protein n=1 Tax=Favolaschia claudopus TaxID=2862362 RepID=A0AAW0EEU4_9AGAR